MNKKEFDLEKELEDLKHKHQLEQTEAEKQARIELEKIKHENAISLHNMKREDFQKKEKRRGKRFS